MMLQYLIRDVSLTVQNYRNVYPFIRSNQLWKGLMDYGWVSKFLAVVGLVVSLKFYSFFSNWISQEANNGFFSANMFSLVGDTISEGYNMFVMGGFKYAILILMEIVIFHFARKTLQVLTGDDMDASLQAFIKAQVRMFKVVIFSYIMETVFSILLGTLISAVGLEFIKPVVLFGIQCFFLGFVIVDNYNEIYEMEIRQSFKYTRQYFGVAIAIGLVVYILMLLPIVGPLLAPLLGAVVATITMHELEKEDDAMEAIFIEK